LDATPKRSLEIEIRRTRDAILIANGLEHRELSEVAGLIWRLSNGTRTIADIAAEISDVYDVDEATATHDALEFLDQLAGDGFITWVQSAAAA
jgi:hypothetical protein